MARHGLGPSWLRPFMCVDCIPRAQQRGSLSDDADGSRLEDAPIIALRDKESGPAADAEARINDDA